MSFDITTRRQSPLRGSLYYFEDEYSFDFFPDPGQEPGYGAAVVLVGTLQIAIDLATGQAVYVFGLRPRIRWIERPLSMPPAKEGAVFFSPADGEKFISGVGLQYPGADQWPTYHDARTGWICVGDPTPTEAYEIATGTALGVDNGQLKSIWMRPSIREAP